MCKVLDLESYISGNTYNTNLNSKAIERFSYKLVKASKINKFSRIEVNGLLRRDSEVSKEPFLFIKYSYLVRRFIV